MDHAHLGRQVTQTQSDFLLKCCIVGMVEDDSVRVDVDAAGIEACALGLDECDAVLHCCDAVLCTCWESRKQFSKMRLSLRRE
jgi:hypothetical protein